MKVLLARPFGARYRVTNRAVLRPKKSVLYISISALLLSILTVAPNATIAPAKASVASGEILRFDATNPDSYTSDLGTTWNDLASVKNGSLVNGVSFNSRTKAFDFDGVDDYVDLPDLSNDLSNGFAIHAVVDFGAAKNYERLFEFSAVGTRSSIALTRVIETNQLALEAWKGAESSSCSGPSDSIQPGFRTYGVVVQADGSCKFYRDGIALTTTGTLAWDTNVTRTDNFLGADRNLASARISIQSFIMYNTPQVTPVCRPYETTTSTNKILQFTTVGTCSWTNPTSISNASYLTVAGGGAGGFPSGNNRGPGGGGAGGLLTGSKDIAATTHSITVGRGGAPVTTADGNGANTSAFSVSVTGGGRGGTAGPTFPAGATNANGSAGGSGGGAANDAGSVGSASPSGQGNAGGTQTGNSSGGGAGGGGGGAGRAGYNASGTGAPANGGNGGDALANSITGVSTLYAGGGGGAHGGGGTGGTGASGVGGSADFLSGAIAQSGLSGRGGGGGGSRLGTPGAGGSGIVIVSYALPTVTFDSKGGSAVPSVSFEAGDSIAEPTAPTRSGYTFGGWSTTEDGSAITWPYSPAGNSNITLHAKWTPSQTVDYALNLNGTTSQSAAASGVDVIPSTGDFTVQAWVKPATDQPRYGIILSQGSTSAGNSFYLNRLNLAGNANNSQIAYRRPGLPFQYCGIAAPSDRWTHVAVTFSGSTSTCYINGIRGTSATATWTSISSGNFLIGNWVENTTSTDYRWKGAIDEVRVHSRALNATEINTDLKTYGPVNASGLVAYFDFNEGSGTTGFNQKYAASSATNLTLSGTPTFADVAIATTTSTSNVVTFPRTYLNNMGGWAAPSLGTSLNYLVVGGGGGGGIGIDTAHGGGGGGAGGYRTNVAGATSGRNSSAEASFTVADSRYPVVVGLGGGAQPRRSTEATNGGSSTFATITSSGGGRGANYYEFSATVGGSGGGGAASTDANRLAGAAGTTGQGFAGGNGHNNRYGGGGGGAGSAGSNATSSSPGAGGAGLASTISGSSVTRAAGGIGGHSTTGGAGVSGAPNTGNGGSGGNVNSGTIQTAGSGGSGIVILAWSETYTVTYNYDDATGGNTTASEDYVAGSTALVLPTPTKTGYTFAGWFSDSAKTSLVGNGGDSYTPSATETLYAKWNVNRYTIVYNYDNATGGNTVSSSDYTFGASALVLPTPTRTGFTFDGWHSDAAKTVLVGLGGASYTPTDSGSLYAKWTANTFTVTYAPGIGGAGDGPTSPATASFGSTFTTPANTYTRTGYTFAGWSDGTSTFAAGATYPTTGSVSANVTLTATWSAIACNPTSTVTGNYTLSSFTSTGTCIWTLPEGVSTARVLIVGGGGGAGSGGGGGGGFLDTTKTGLNGDVAITVGSGGSGSTTTSMLGSNGSASSFGDSTAGGGAGGGRSPSSASSGLNAPTGVTVRGSGGGGNNNASALGGTGSTSGGAGVSSSVAGGGGGAAQSGNINGLGRGGDGKATDISGLTEYFSGGGGGGTSACTRIAGGSGGGGLGARCVSANAPQGPNGIAGGANTGGGGGGAGGASFEGTGGEGGSGIVKVKYISSALTPTFSNPISTSDGFTINITNYDANFTFTISASVGTVTTGVASGTTLPLTITGISSGVSSIITAQTSANGFSGSASATGSANLATRTLTIDSGSFAATFDFDATPPTITSTASAGTGSKSYTSSTTNVCNIGPSSGLVTFVTTGTCTISASIASDGTYSSASSSPISFAITRTYIITYAAGVGGSGTGPTSPVTVLNDASFTTPVNTFTKAGYAFAGWSDGNTIFAEGARYPASGSITGPVTLTATWQGNANTVTYNSKGGSPVANGSFVTGGSISSAPTPPTRTGYIFDGWTATDGGTTVITFPYSPSETSAITLYAKWTEITYTITYNRNGATGSPERATDTYTYTGGGVTLATVGSMANTGYTFDGWQESGTTTKLSSPYIPSADVTLEARWSAASYTITYFSNSGGTAPNADTYTTGNAALTLPTQGSMARSGYTFNGWSTTINNVSTKIAGSETSATLTTSAPVNLFALWTAIPYSVTYANTDSNSGTVPTDATVYNIGDNIVVKANTGGANSVPLARTGYSFAGWTDNIDRTGTVYKSGDTYEVGAASVTFYPMWTANTYTLTYNANGATGAPIVASTTYKTGDDPVQLTGRNNMAKAGHTFMGWSTNPTGIGQATATATANVTLYAIWDLNQYRVSFNPGVIGGNNLTMSTVSTLPDGYDADYNSTITLGTSPTDINSSITYSLNGVSGSYRFLGWSDGTTNYPPGATYVIGTSAPTFAAQWVQVLEVRYILNGGTGIVDVDADDCDVSTYLCEDGDQINLSLSPSRLGYTFAGWTTDATGSGQLLSPGSSFTVSPSAFIFYAKWTPDPYTMSFNSNGGSISTSAFDKNIGQSFTFPSPGSRAGYDFNGWIRGDIQNSPTYGAGTTFVTGSSSIPFIASWTPQTYTISYNWNGGVGSPTSPVDFTVGNTGITLPTGTNLRDGYVFDGWQVAGTTTKLTSPYSPTATALLEARWLDGAYTITFDAKKNDLVDPTSSVTRATSLTLPTPTRAGFSFEGWYQDADYTLLYGAGGASVTPTASRTVYAKWVQNSLAGINPAHLNELASITMNSSWTNSLPPLTHLPSSTTFSLDIPNGALPDDTVVKVSFVEDLTRPANLIDGNNAYFTSVVVHWLTGTGEAATVPDAVSGKALTLTITNPSIVAGAKIFKILGGVVTETGTAIVNGQVTITFTQDPEFVVAATRPGSPTAVTATNNQNAQSTVSWNAPLGNGGSSITGYTATASPGGATCTTAGTSCQFTGLTNDTSYTFTVIATNAIGDSLPSSPSSAITPRLAINYNVIFNSNGGTPVGNSSFVENGTLSAPTDPTRNGFNFIGWATVNGDESTIISFPYSPSNADLTLYAIWRASNPALNPDNSGNNGAITTPISTKPSAAPSPTPKAAASAKPTAKATSTAKPTSSASPVATPEPSEAPTATPKPTQSTDPNAVAGESGSSSGSGFDNLILGLMALLGAFLTAGLGLFAARVMRKSK